MVEKIGVAGISLLLLLAVIVPINPGSLLGVGKPGATSTSQELLNSASASLKAGDGPAAGHALSCTTIGTLSMGCLESSKSSKPSSSAEGWSKLCSFDSCAPAGRGGAGLTYDPMTGYIVLFGGIDNLTTAADTTYNDTWTFKAGNWTQLHIPGPSARLGQYMAYDYKDNYVVLFGGGPYLTLNSSLYFDDSWTFQNGTWTQLNLANHPNARGLGAMVWDPQGDYLIMYGGMTSQTDVHSDTWTFSGGQWQNLSVAQHPPPLLAPTMAWDPEAQYVLLFGGATPAASAEFGLDLEQTWDFANGTWTNLTSQIHGSPPDGRILASMAYDWAQGFMILYAGWNTTTGALYGDTWIFEDNTWRIYFVSPSPAAAMIGANMISTTPNAGTFLFGGIVGTYTSYRSTNATWVFGPPPSNTKITIVLPPSPYVVSFSLAPTSCKAVVFNGSLITNGESDVVLSGSYFATAAPCQGYNFNGWFESGGLILNSTDSSTANFDVTGNGTLTAYYAPASAVSYQANAPELAGSVVGVVVIVALTVFIVRRHRGA